MDMPGPRAFGMGVGAVAAVVAAGWSVSAPAETSISAPKLAKLPLNGSAPNHQRFRLSAGKPSAGDDVKSSWCLDLKYTGGIVLIRDGHPPDPFSSGNGACGPKPAPAVSGLLSYDCQQKVTYVFGGVRSSAGKLRLASKGGALTTYRAALPPRSGFSGSSYIAAVAFRDLPASLKDARGHRVIRLDSGPSVCDGLPDNAQPFKTFP
jgi:hypothetical protein